MDDRWRVSAGTQVLIGAPATPMPANALQALHDAIIGAKEVAFAYIPQMYINGQIDPPRQVLFLILRDSARGKIDQVMPPVMAAIQANWPLRDIVDALPAFADHPWLSDVIRTGCLLHVNDDDLHRRCVKRSS